MTTDIAAIAAGLTKAQREAIANTRGTHEDGEYWFPLGSARGIGDEHLAALVHAIGRADHTTGLVRLCELHTILSEIKEATR